MHVSSLKNEETARCTGSPAPASSRYAVRCEHRRGVLVALDSAVELLQVVGLLDRVVTRLVRLEQRTRLTAERTRVHDQRVSARLCLVLRRE